MAGVRGRPRGHRLLPADPAPLVTPPRPAGSPAPRPQALTTAPGWAWPVVVCVIFVLLTIDLLASRRPGIPRAALISAAWLGAGVAFGLILTVWQGARSGEQYFAAYALEKALSVDNLFVFAMLFRAFAVPVASQHRVLLAGVAGARTCARQWRCCWASSGPR